MHRMKKSVLLLLVILSFCCCQRNVKTICGVPIKGTPWQLAAAIHDKGDKTFSPETVTEYENKAIIHGWLNTNNDETPYREEPYDDGLLPAEIICDVQNGKVVDAVTYCKQFEGE